MRQLNNLLIALMIFFVGLLCCSLFILPHIDPQEARLALFTQYMLYHGWSMIPRAYANLSDINFSTLVTLSYVSALSFGKFTAMAIALPGAVASAISLAGVYLIGALRSRSWGFAAALFMLGTEVFFLNARILSVAPFITAIMVLSLYTAIELELAGFFLYSSLFILFVIGFLFQGVMGVMLPFLLVAMYLVWRLKWKKLLYVLVAAAIVIALGLTLLTVAAGYEGGPQLSQQILTGQMKSVLPQAGSSLLATHWTYLLWYCASLPLAILVVILRWPNLIWPSSPWGIQLLRALISWVVLIIAVDIIWGMQFLGILPLVPALALIAAYLFNNEHVGIFTENSRKLVLFLFSALPFLALILVASFFISNYFHHNAHTPFYLETVILLLLLCVLTVFLRAFKTQSAVARAICIMLLAIASYVVVNIGVIEPVLASKNKTQAFANRYHRILNKKAGDTVFYQIGPGQQDMLFMVDLHMRAIPQFITKPEQISTQKKAYFITTFNNYQNLAMPIKKQTKVVLNGYLNHDKAVVFVYQDAATAVLPTVKTTATVVRTKTVTVQK